MDPVQLDSIRGLEGLGTRKGEDSKAEVAREFEALLVGEMIKTANKPVLGGDKSLTGGSAAEIWRDMFLEQVVRAGAGSFGLASETLKALDEKSDEKPNHLPDTSNSPLKEKP